jgi:hypothetical protein
MSNWKKLLGPMPKKGRYAVGALLASAAVVIVAKTARTIPIPWQAIPLGCVVGVMVGATQRIGSDTIATAIEVVVMDCAFAYGLHFYPAALRDGAVALWQLGALIVLPAMVVISLMEYLGLRPKHGVT